MLVAQISSTCKCTTKKSDPSSRKLFASVQGVFLANIASYIHFLIDVPIPSLFSIYPFIKSGFASKVGSTKTSTSQEDRRANCEGWWNTSSRHEVAGQFSVANHLGSKLVLNILNHP